MAEEQVEFLRARARTGSLEFGEYYGSLLKRFCQENDGKRLFLTITAGEAPTIEAQGCFHGPILTAYSRATGDTDRVKIKAMLKKMFLSIPDGKGGIKVKKTRDLTDGEYKKFNRQCRDLLMDQFGAELEPMEEKQIRRSSWNK